MVRPRLLSLSHPVNFVAGCHYPSPLKHVENLYGFLMDIWIGDLYQWLFDHHDGCMEHPYLEVVIHL